MRYANNLIDALLKDEIFGPICPVIKGDFRNAYTATKQ
jgi:aldehyde dehydrogenase (NAD+)